MRRGLPYAAPAPGQDAAAAPGPEHQAEEAAAVPVGSRCEVDPGAKRGVVRWDTRMQPARFGSALPVGFRCKVDPGAKRGIVRLCGPPQGARLTWQRYFCLAVQ